MLLRCPLCGTEFSLPADMVAGKNIRCCGCGKRQPYSSYANPSAQAIAEEQREAEDYAAHVAEALERENARKEAAAERAAKAKADEERQRAEVMALAFAFEDVAAKTDMAAKAIALRLEAERKAKEEAERRRKEDEVRRAEEVARRKAEEARRAEEEARRKAEEERRKAEEARRQAEDAKRRETWKKEGRYATIGSLRMQNSTLFILDPGANTVGRSEKAKIQISADNRVSRPHLVIDVSGSRQQGFLHEVSLIKAEVNDTYVNKEKMAFGKKYVLRNGDSISIPIANIVINFIAI